MFSQWRHTIETLAHSPKSSQDAASEGSSLDAALRQSLSSSSQLADAALSNLRKTLITQRPASPGPKSPANEPSGSPRPRTTLEDRLRAKFAIGEASTGTSPNPSTRSTPSSTPTPVVDHPLSPSPSAVATSDAPAGTERPLSPPSIPLPDSPALSPSIQAPQPLSAITSQSLLAEPEPETVGNSSASDDVERAPADAETEQAGPATVDDTAAVSVATEDVSLTDSKEVLSTEPEGDPEPIPVESAEVDPPPVEVSDVSMTDNIPSDTNTRTEASESPGDSVPLNAQAETPAASDDVHPPPEQSTSSAPSNEDTLSEEQPQAPPADSPGSPSSGEEDTPSPKPEDPDIEGLRQRLKLVEQRFTDVSTSFKRLQAEKAAADRVLREFTPLESIQETDALQDYLQNITLKAEMAQDEIKRLTGKLTRQEERIEELRDTHRLESKSQSEEIHRLRGQLSEVESLMKATQNSVVESQAESLKRESEITRLQGELVKVRATAKDEEEKRVKAIGLLKTVRQKLVKAEKERDDTFKETQALRAKENEERERERAERQRLQEEIEKVKAERESTLQAFKAQSDKEIASLKDRHEKEISALRGQFELDTVTLTSVHSRETEIKDSRISELESLVKTLTTDKDELFDQLQMRQAELESSQSRLESLQSQYVESQYQLREATDRIGLLNEELAESHRDQSAKVLGGGSSTEEVTRLLAAAEAKYEGRIADLRRQLVAVERERDDGEADFSKKLAERAKEIEQLKAIVDASARDHQEEKGVVTELQEQIASLTEQAQAYNQIIAELRVEAGKVTEVESASQAQVAEINARVLALQKQLEEHKTREAQVRAHNKTLREELRKVQSSAALLERQRNPGVGYWASKSDGLNEPRSPTSSVSDLASPRPSSPSPSKSEEEVNFEYLRNVILQFLEHKEMRPDLVRIVSTILRFTPSETRRLMAKV